MKHYYSLFFLAGFLISLTVGSCTKPDDGTEPDGNPTALPVPETFDVTVTETTAEISWSDVEGSDHYRFELFCGSSAVKDSVVTGTAVSLDNLTPGATYVMNLYACPAEGSEEYTESEALPIEFTTDAPEFIITVGDFYTGEYGFKYVELSWVPADKKLLYLPYADLAEFYDTASSEEEYLNTYIESLRQSAMATGQTLEQYLSQFLKTGDFTGSSVIPAPGKYYAMAFGCTSDGTPTTGLYMAVINAE